MKPNNIPEIKEKMYVYVYVPMWAHVYMNLSGKGKDHKSVEKGSIIQWMVKKMGFRKISELKNDFFVPAITN